ncbi:MAG: MarC family protein [Dehalococcoidia bacterium]
MSDWVRLAFVFLAAVNPAAVALSSWAPWRPRERPKETACVGFIVATAGVVLAAILADRLLAALDIAPETFRIAAGLVMLAAGGYAVVRAKVAAAPFEDGWRGGISPLAVPLLLGPAVLVAAISYGADEGAATAITASVPALAIGSMLTAARPGRWTALADGVARLLGVALVAVAAGLIVEGVRDI